MLPVLLADWLGFFTGLFIFFFVIISMILILLVLIQKGRGGGLASAFGGSGGNSAFGAKTGDVLTWVTSVAFGIFLVLAIILTLLVQKSEARLKAKAGAPVRNSTPAK
jgi:preprotein translocase subunit SecG